MRNCTRLVLLTVIAGGWMWAFGAAAQAEPVEKLIDELEAKYKALKCYELSRRILTNDPDTNKESTSTVWAGAFDKVRPFRIESAMQATATIRGKTQRLEMVTIVVFDGKAIWQEQTKNGQTKTFKKKPTVSDPYISVYDNLKAGPATLLDTTTVAGEECVVIRAVYPKAGAGETSIYTICKANGLILKSVTEAPGGLVIKEEITSFKANHDIDKSKFVYTAPPGVQVIDMEEIKARSRARKHDGN